MSWFVDDDRWVVLGLAGPRSGWFNDVARWANAAALPVDFVKCVSADEVRARLSSGRSYSALLVASDVGGLDRDLVDVGRSAGSAVIVVGDRRRDWSDLGASALLPEGFDRTELLATLRECAPPVNRVASRMPDAPTDLDTTWRGHLIGVTGPGGTGSSILAMALAQGLGSDASNRGLVLLADLALEADQAMLHDARELVPGVQELVESHRGGRLDIDQIRAMAYDAPARSYHLLLGLRRHRDWTVLRPRALEAAVDGLQRSYRVVIADVDPDLEGETETGSRDVEDRNLLARSVLQRADLTVVVGLGDLKGLHALVRTLRELVEGGVETGRMVLAVNRAPRSPRRRAEISATLADLVDRSLGEVGLDNPVFVPERRDVEAAIHDGVRLPRALGRTLTLETRRRLDRDEPRRAERDLPEPVVVQPGSLGHWTEERG